MPSEAPPPGFRAVLDLSGEARAQALELGARELPNGRLGVPRSAPLARFSTWLTEVAPPVAPSLGDYLEGVAANMRAGAPPVTQVRCTVTESHLSASGHGFLWLADNDRTTRAMMPRPRAGDNALILPSPGESILAAVSPEYSPTWGFRLLVSDWTSLGENPETMARRLRLAELQILAGTTGERPPLPRRLARVLIIAPEGAGFDDLMATCAIPVAAGLLHLEVRHAVFDGPGARHALGGTLDAIRLTDPEGHAHDAVCVVRGGGPPSSLAWLDHPDILAAAARLPLPLLTGIGHERDVPLLDALAARAFGTPSKAAAFLAQNCETLPVEALLAMRQMGERASDLANRARETADAALHRVVRASPNFQMARGFALMRALDGTPLRAPLAAGKFILLHANGETEVSSCTPTP